MQVTFAGFDVDFDQRRLFGRDGEVRLAPKAFDLLRLLIETRPKAIAKGEIFARLWPDTFATENCARYP
jgi:DNA-binding winged helix-turn-helix (wHTH) protein